MKKAAEDIDVDAVIDKLLERRGAHIGEHCLQRGEKHTCPRGKHAAQAAVSNWSMRLPCPAIDSYSRTAELRVLDRWCG